MFELSMWFASYPNFFYISDYRYRLPEAGLHLVQFLEIVLAAEGSGYPLT
jgi:hypothetical protein